MTDEPNHGFNVEETDPMELWLRMIAQPMVASQLRLTDVEEGVVVLAPTPEQEAEGSNGETGPAIYLYGTVSPGNREEHGREQVLELFLPPSDVQLRVNVISALMSTFLSETRMAKILDFMFEQWVEGNEGREMPMLAEEGIKAGVLQFPPSWSSET